jgi:hypothetical protein
LPVSTVIVIINVRPEQNVAKNRREVQFVGWGLPHHRSLLSVGQAPPYGFWELITEWDASGGSH